MPDLTRITVNLTPRATAALDRRVAAGDSKTDTINRALRVYDLVQGLIDDGRALHLTGPDGTQERIHLLL